MSFLRTAAQIRVQLASNLLGVVSQVLCPGSTSPAGPWQRGHDVQLSIRNNIRMGKTESMFQILQTSAAEGMQTMDQSLTRLCREGQIDYEIAKPFIYDKGTHESLKSFRPPACVRRPAQWKEILSCPEVSMTVREALRRTRLVSIPGKGFPVEETAGREIQSSTDGAPLRRGGPLRGRPAAVSSPWACLSGVDPQARALGARLPAGGNGSPCGSRRRGRIPIGFVAAVPLHRARHLLED